MRPLNLTPPEIRDLAERVGFDPCDRRAAELAEMVQQEIAVRMLADLRGVPVVVRYIGGGERILATPPAAAGKRCQAAQHGDQMLCGRCGLSWDVGDAEPPACAPVERRISMRREADR